MYVVTLAKRFDNPEDNIPLFASRLKRDAERFISNEVKKDCGNKDAIRDFFNGDWTESELKRSFRNDYRIFKVGAKIPH